MSEDAVDRGKVIEGLILFPPLALHALINKKKYTYTVIQYRGTEEKKDIHNTRYTSIRDLTRYNSSTDNTINCEIENDKA